MEKRRGARLLMYIVLLFLTAIWLYPIVLAVYKSVAVGGWRNYSVVMHHDTFNYWRAVLNSFFLAGVSAGVIVLIASLAGFAFSKMYFVGKEVIYKALLACLAVPIAALITPLFATLNNVGLRDKYIGVIIPLISFNVIVMILMMRAHFDSFPNEVIEAAMLDGCSSWRIFWKVLMPVSGPSLATIGVLSFVYSWNEWLLPTLLLKTEEKFPITQAISLLQTERMSQEQISQLYAGLILMTIPSIVVYLFSQRYLQAGITAGSVKS